MEDFFVLGVSLLIAGGAAVAGLIVHQTLWKEHRRRQLERRHFRNKVR